MWETTLLLVAGWLQSFLVNTAQVNNVKKQSAVSANLNPHTCKTHPITSPGFGTNWVWSSGGRDRLRPPNRVSHKQSALLCVLLPSPIQYIRWVKRLFPLIFYLPSQRGPKFCSKCAFVANCRPRTSRFLWGNTFSWGQVRIRVLWRNGKKSIANLHIMHRQSKIAVPRYNIHIICKCSL